MRPAPPSLSNGDTPPGQSNGNAHGDGTGIDENTANNTNPPPPPTAAATPEPADDEMNEFSPVYITTEEGVQYQWSPNHSFNGTPLTEGAPEWQRNQDEAAPYQWEEVNRVYRMRVPENFTRIARRRRTATDVAAAERSNDANDAMDETENGNEYRRSSLNRSPNDTQLTPSNNLNRLLSQGAVAPLSGETGNGNNTNGDGDNGDTTNETTHPPPHNIFPTTESNFRHPIPTSNTTALTASNLTAALECRFSTPANLDDVGKKTPNTGNTGFTTSTEQQRSQHRT